MTDAEIKDIIRRWMNGDGSVIAEVATKEAKEHRAFFAFTDGIGKRSSSVEKLAAAVRRQIA
jgi:hypothetical protein